MEKFYSEVWEDYPYKFDPKRNMNINELNAIIKYMFSQKVYDQKFYDGLPEELKEFFVEKEPPKEKKWIGE